MLWKILSALSGACLAGAAFFAWLNQQDLEKERIRLSFANANLKAAQERKAEGDDSLKSRQEMLATAQKDRDAAREEVLKLTAEAQEKEAALAVIKGNLEQVTAQVTSVEKQIADAGDIEKLVAQIEKLKKEQQDAEGAVANQTQRVASAKEQYDYVVSQITKLRDTEAQGRRGIVAPDFTARVAQYFPEWDFAILSKGNSQGVFANADLEVKRGRQVIAKLKVRNVEQYGAIADLIPGSLLEGNSIRAGDTVVAAAKQSSEAPPKPMTDGTTPPTETPAPQMDADTPAAPMGSDPFGAPAAPAPAMGSDPFGAPATPAPAPASDPFGAPATPAAPAPASDPFGAPATPPAAPAGGASMTSDPFN
ncbi:hypothetical protein WJU23_19675 [Prosthecobacter sp. SYSU 5D2]|uniref:hypothetical protein n=1 Tax=Prosthecobacter sp. SYSU 5D2 TaxID=3134134 RepID=UPI0031FEC9AB